MRIILFIFGVIILQSCTEPSMDPMPRNGYPGKIAVIIERNCLGGNCHSSPTAENRGLDLSTWETMMRGDREANNVIPFNARLSFLYQHINTDRDRSIQAEPRMPLARDPLTDEDQVTIYDWINAGARNADGRIPYDTVTQKFFIASQGDDVLAVLDASTDRLIRGDQFTKLTQPKALCSDKDCLFLGFQADKGRLIKLHRDDLRILGEFRSTLAVSAVHIPRNMNRGYIGNYPSSFKHRIGIFNPDQMTMVRVAEYPEIRSAVNFLSTSDGTTLFAAGYESDNILIINTADQSVAGNILLGDDVISSPSDDYIPKYSPSDMYLSVDEKFLYVTCFNNHSVKVIDLTTNTVVERIPVGIFPTSMSKVPNTDELWVINRGSESISILSETGRNEIQRIDSVGKEPAAIAFTADGSKAYIVCQGKKGASHHGGAGPAPSSVVVVDRASRKILKEIEMPTYSTSIVRGY